MRNGAAHLAYLSNRLLWSLDHHFSSSFLRTTQSLFFIFDELIGRTKLGGCTGDAVLFRTVLCSSKGWVRIGVVGAPQGSIAEIIEDAVRDLEMADKL